MGLAGVDARRTHLEEDARVHAAADAFAGRASKVVEALLSEKRGAFRVVIVDQRLRAQRVALSCVELRRALTTRVESTAHGGDVVRLVCAKGALGTFATRED